MCINFAAKKVVLTLLIVAFLFAVAVNELNLRHIKNVNPTNQLSNMSSTLYGYTIWCVDNGFYLPQIKNSLAGGGFTMDTRNPESTVRRTPVYPLFYGLHYVAFGERYSFFFIRYTQIILHLLAVLLLGQAVFNLTSNRFLATLTAFLYALNPFTVIFLYTTITEGISPALTIFVLFFFSLSVKMQNYKNYFLLGLSIGIALLNRPAVIAIVPPLLLALIIKDKLPELLTRRTFANFTFLILGAAVVLMPWTIRNFIITRDFVPLEKIYYGDSSHYEENWGRGHMAFLDWISCWDNPANTNPLTYVNDVVIALKRGEDINHFADNFIEKTPDFVFAVNSKQDVANVLGELNDCFREKNEAYKANPSIIRKEASEKFTCEDRVSSKFNDLTNEFRAKSSFRYHFITPLIFLKSVVFHSNSYMYAMLNPPDGNFKWWQICVKSAMYLLNLAMFFSVLPFIFLNRKLSLELKVLVTGFTVLILLLPYFYIHYIEVRYLIPCFPALYISLAFVIHRMLQPLKKAAFPANAKVGNLNL